MLLNFTETTNLFIRSWEIERLMTRKGNGKESVIEYITANAAVGKDMKLWVNENRHFRPYNDRYIRKEM